MRRIVPKHVEKKKQKRTQYIVGFVLIALMFLSVLGYSFQGGTSQKDSETITYKGLEFINQNGLWYLATDNAQFSFKYNPEQTLNIDSTLNNLDNYYNKPLYISSENLEAQYEISRNLYLTGIVQRFQPACPEEDICKEDIPTITCDNNFIIIKENEEISITQKNNCILIKGPQEKLVELTDEFLFKVFEIK